ncbi:MAG TPA: hypothetical protein VFJ06_05255 [Halococcus sp.]|nr:hypothetical protein [Halococcus sp.]
MPLEEENNSRLLRCIQCGTFYPARSPKMGKLVPSGGSAGGRCKNCGSDEFERVTLAE